MDPNAGSPQTTFRIIETSLTPFIVKDDVRKQLPLVAAHRPESFRCKGAASSEGFTAQAAA
jgi:hypothetical protein